MVWWVNAERWINSQPPSSSPTFVDLLLLIFGLQPPPTGKTWRQNTKRNLLHVTTNMHGLYKLKLRPNGSASADDQVRCGDIHRSSASPRPPCDGTPSASVWPSPRQTPGPSCPYPSDRTPHDATMKPVVAPSAWFSHSDLDKKESDG